MHTVASNKVSAKDRELAPRFYYKVSEKTTCGQKLRNALKIFLTFMFTQVGVIVLIGSFFIKFFRVETDSLQVSTWLGVLLSFNISSRTVYWNTQSEQKM